MLNQYGEAGRGTGPDHLAADRSGAEERTAKELAPRESFRRVSHIALLMSYDLIDKLRWLEKDTLGRSDEEVAARARHTQVLLDRLTAAYLGFAEVDL
jgi:hypothetical protein